MRMNERFANIEYGMQESVLRRIYNFVDEKSSSARKGSFRNDKEIRSLSSIQKDQFFGKVGEFIASDVLNTRDPDTDIHKSNSDDGIDLIDHNGKRYGVKESKSIAQSYLITNDNYSKVELDNIDFHVFVRIDNYRYIDTGRIFYDIGILSHLLFNKMKKELKAGEFIPGTNHVLKANNFCVYVDKFSVPEIKRNTALVI
jgi:hypothetical protein